MIILLSDGFSSPLSSGLDTDLTTNNVIVHTLGMGYGADSSLLHDIAFYHQGEYHWIQIPGGYNRMAWILNIIREKINGINTPVQTTPSATIAAGGTVTQNLQVDSAMGSMSISFFKSVEASV